MSATYEKKSTLSPADIPSHTRNRAQQWIAGLRVAMELFGTAKAYQKAMEKALENDAVIIQPHQLRVGDEFAIHPRGATWRICGINKNYKKNLFMVAANSLDSGRSAVHEIPPDKLLYAR